MMVVRVSDGEAYISTFNEEAEKIIGCSTDELDNLRSQVSYRMPVLLWKTNNENDLISHRCESMYMRHL